MKLRNKKNGKVYNACRVCFYEPIDDVEKRNWKTLKEFCNDWEDYVPKEPLIKDEKIRKAVRAWAEANGIGGCVCKEEIHCITFETDRGMFISFENADYIPPEGNFTIAELCGEEEE